MQSKLLKFKYVAFDLDGTLIDSMQLNYQCWRAVLNEVGVPLQKNLYFQREGEKISSIIKDVLDVNCIESSPLFIENLIEKKDNLFTELYQFNPYPFVAEVVDTLKKNGVILGIVTSGRLSRVLRTLPQSFLNNFDAIITGEDSDRGKPFPDPYLRFMHVTNSCKENTLVLENAPLGIKSAKSAGIYCVGIASTVGRDLLKEADLVLDSIGEFYERICNEKSSNHYW
jgi:beta-phosphoglucomutase